MPRRHSPPKYRLHKGSGQAFIEILGKRHYCGVHGTDESHAEYQRMIEVWRASAAAANVADGKLPADVTIGELCGPFWEHADGYYRRPDPYGQGNGADVRQRKLTYNNLKPALRRLRERIGHLEARRFGRAELKELRRTWLQEISPKTKRKLTRKTINNYVGNVKLFIHWAADEGYIPGSVWEDMKAVKLLAAHRTEARETQDVPPVPDAIVERTLPHLPRVVAHMVQLQRLTGARPGEIRLIRPCDVRTRRLEESHPLFRDVSVWEYRPASHKTQHHGQQRVIFIGPKAQEILRSYLKRPAKSFCFSPAESEAARLALSQESQTLLFPAAEMTKPTRKRPPRNHYSKDAYARAIARACEFAFAMPQRLRKINRKLTDAELASARQEAAAWREQHVWKPNQLRHAAATYIRERYGLEASQVVLGHAEADTTQIYAERDLARAAQIAREVG